MFLTLFVAARGAMTGTDMAMQRELFSACGVGADAAVIELEILTARLSTREASASVCGVEHISSQHQDSIARHGKYIQYD